MSPGRGLGSTHRPLSSSFLGLPYRSRKINHIKKELLRSPLVGVEKKPYKGTKGPMGRGVRVLCGCSFFAGLAAPSRGSRPGGDVAAGVHGRGGRWLLHARWPIFNRQHLKCICCNMMCIVACALWTRRPSAPTTGSEPEAQRPQLPTAMGRRAAQPTGTRRRSSAGAASGGGKRRGTGAQLAARGQGTRRRGAGPLEDEQDGQEGRDRWLLGPQGPQLVAAFGPAEPQPRETQYP